MTIKPNCKNCWRESCQMIGCDMQPCAHYIPPDREPFENYVRETTGGRKEEPFCPFLGCYCDVKDCPNACYHCDFAWEACEQVHL